jgi:soluble lytic murein transglycosylase
MKAIRNMNVLLHAVVSCSLISFFILFCSPGTGGGATSKDSKSEIVELFKAGRHQDIIELAQKADQLSEQEQLLLAKSYEELGFYHRSNRVLKTLFNENTEFKEYIPLFIGYNYEKLEDYYSALKWYRITVGSKIEDSDDEGRMLLISVLERVVAIGESDPCSFGQCIRAVKKSRKLTSLEEYYLGRLYEAGGDKKESVRYYTEVIGGADNIAKKKVLERFAADKRLLRELDDFGLSTTNLLELLVEQEQWDNALSISYLLPENKKIASIRALCHYKTGDYEIAESLYKEYYDNYNDPDALKKLAYSSYHNGKRDLAYQYIDQYLSLENHHGEPDVEALFLKHDLERRRLDLDAHFQEAGRLIRYKTEQLRNDWIIQEAFYRAVDEGRLDAGTAFIMDSYRFLGSSLGRAWAMFVLGIYKDESHLNKAVTLFPGSYYYFRAADRIELDNDLLSRADKYHSSGQSEKALQLYIQLYSKGYQREYLRKRIVSILSAQEQYKPFMQIAWIERGRIRSVLFDLLQIGLYDEVREIILLSYDWVDSEHRMLSDYLLSRIYYETGHIYRGALHAERIVNGSDISSRLFLPREILTLLYPRVYTDIIGENISEAASNPDELFILAVIREESRYNPSARSSQGAIGLMQLLPETAEWMASTNITEAELVDPQKNISIGILYLHYLFSRFDSPFHVLAAYNGGPNNVKRWLSRLPNADDDTFTEQIPFPETRNFVKKVITSYNMYRELYEQGTPANEQ